MSTTTNGKRTKKFKALVALLDGNEAAAIVSWNLTHPDEQIPDEPVSTAASTAAITSKETSDVQVAKAGLIHVRGRVYVTPELIEAQVRVLKTGRPELVTLAGEHRTKAVAAYRTDDGKTVALQNLGVPN